MTKKIKGIVPGPRPKNRNTLLDNAWVDEAEPRPVTDLPFFGIIDWNETNDPSRST